MKKITFKNLVNLLKSNGLLAVAGGLLLMSCGSQMGYTETDGVYYDPSRDTLPEGTVMNSGNRVGEYYDYQATDSTNKYLNTDNRNENWRDNSTSDWGNYNGTDTYYNDSSWGYPSVGVHLSALAECMIRGVIIHIMGITVLFMGTTILTMVTTALIMATIILIMVTVLMVMDITTVIMGVS